MPSCQAQGCSKATTRWRAYCNGHKSRLRRHGHPHQEGVTVAALKPYVQRVRQRIAKNDDSAVWPQIEDRWQDLVVRSRSEIAAYQSGQPANRQSRDACHEIVKLADAVEPRLVIETGLALFLMRDDAPRQFQSDDAFLFQITRRLRGLTDVNAGSWWDQSSGRAKRVYRDLAPRSSAIMGQRVAETLGAVGLWLARLERQDADAKLRVNQELAAALGGLK